MDQMMSMLFGAFSVRSCLEATDADDSNHPSPLEELRLAVERAEAAGVEEESLDVVRARLAELECEVQRELAVVVRHAVSSEVVTVVRSKPSDTVSRLREAVLRETGEAGVAMLACAGQAHQPRCCGDCRQ